MPSGVYQRKIDQLKRKTLSCTICQKNYERLICKLKWFNSRFCSPQCRWESMRGVCLSKEIRKKISKNSAKVWLGKKLQGEHLRKIQEARKKNVISGKEHYNWKGGKPLCKCGNIMLRESHRCSKCQRKYNSGQNHYNWKGGVTTINEKIRQSIEYKQWRKAVFNRDRFTCQACGQIGGDLHADHELPFSLFPDLRFEVLNGQTLCRECHLKTDTWGYGAIKLYRPNYHRDVKNLRLL